MPRMLVPINRQGKLNSRRYFIESLERYYCLGPLQAACPYLAGIFTREVSELPQISQLHKRLPDAQQNLVKPPRPLTLTLTTTYMWRICPSKELSLKERDKGEMLTRRALIPPVLNLTKSRLISFSFNTLHTFFEGEGVPHARY